MWLGLVPLPGLDHYYVGRKLRKDVLQTVQLFPCHFFAHGRRGVEYFRIGTMWFWVFPIFFIGFQIELSSL